MCSQHKNWQKFCENVHSPEKPSSWSIWVDWNKVIYRWSTFWLNSSPSIKSDYLPVWQSWFGLSIRLVAIFCKLSIKLCFLMRMMRMIINNPLCSRVFPQNFQISTGNCTLLLLPFINHWNKILRRITNRSMMLYQTF